MSTSSVVKTEMTFVEINKTQLKPLAYRGPVLLMAKNGLLTVRPGSPEESVDWQSAYSRAAWGSIILTAKSVIKRKGKLICP